MYHILLTIKNGVDLGLFISSNGLFDDFENLGSDLVGGKLVGSGFVHVDFAGFVGQSFASNVTQDSVLHLNREDLG